MKMVDCVLRVFRHTKDKWARGERRDRWGTEAWAAVRVLARWGVRAPAVLSRWQEGRFLERTARNGWRIGYGPWGELEKEFIRRGPYLLEAC